MMRKLGRALALTVSAASVLAAAPAARAGEIALGGFAHDTSFGVSGTPHESGTTDVQVLYRTHQYDIWWLLHPMFYAKAQINTSGLTNFYTLGIEWRKHLFHSRFYGGFGLGAAYVDGYNTYPDDFDPSRVPPPGAGATSAQIARYDYDLHIYRTRKAMGSDFVFNPNFTFGYDVTDKIAVEAAWEHYSNAGLGGRNPGMDNFGGRLVYRFGGPF